MYYSDFQNFKVRVVFFIHLSWVLLTQLLIGNQNYLHPVANETLRLLDQYHTPSQLVALEFKELADALTKEYSLPNPSNVHDTLSLYFSVTQLIDRLC